MKSEQITFAELLKDPAYRAWFQREPRRGLDRPWRVWIQVKEGGGWRKFDFSTYAKAYKWVKKNWKKVHDLALSCPALQMSPPIIVVGHRNATITQNGVKKQVKVPVKERWSEHHTPMDHHWCGVCRRPTVFGWFRRHHAMPGRDTIPYVRRCRICGASEKFQRYR